MVLEIHNLKLIKGAISDSLKRAAVSFGIGRHLYDLPSIWVKCQSKESNGKFYFQKFTENPWDKVRQKRVILTNDNNTKNSC